MNTENIKLINKDIEEALQAIEVMEAQLSENNLPKESIKENFEFLSKKVQKLEDVLKSEGIL